MEIEKKQGAQPGNKSASLQDPTKRKNCKMTFYFNEKELMKMKKDAKERDLPFSLYVNMLLNKKKLPKRKSNKLIDIL